jgi:hypothetical protein
MTTEVRDALRVAIRGCNLLDRMYRDSEGKEAAAVLERVGPFLEAAIMVRDNMSKILEEDERNNDRTWFPYKGTMKYWVRALTEATTAPKGGADAVPVEQVPMDEARAGREMVGDSTAGEHPGSAAADVPLSGRVVAPALLPEEIAALRFCIYEAAYSPGIQTNDERRIATEALDRIERAQRTQRAPGGMSQ